MKIAILKATQAGESRVAASPDTVKKFVAAGASVTVEAGAGAGSAISDAQYKDAGAVIAKSARDALKGAAIVLAVRRPENLTGFAKGAAVVALMDPYGNEAALAGLAKAGLSALSLELIPRITRAQAMDVLSSQANLAGYQAVIEAAAQYGRAMPMMMTAAGTVPAARVFVMGAGVAGLQAVATARRLGAVVTASDVRPAAKEQVESLGAKFVAVEDEEFAQAETAAGYAKEMSKDYQAKQAELVRAHIAKQDIVITTALIPGRPAPRLIDKAMVKSMQDGSVIVDLAVERGGNVEGARPDEIVDAGGVSIIGYQNMAGRIAASASALLARNIFAFVEPMIDKDGTALSIDREDEIIAATLLTHDGAVVHPDFAQTAKTPAKQASGKPAAKKRAVMKKAADAGEEGDG
jgi:NAD(P) transhydrogenase subunit alpha